MSRELPERPSLAHLKKQAKALVRKVKSGDAEMLSRIRACVRRFADQSDDARLAEWFALHDAQYVIANDYGFASWRELRVAIAQVTDEDISLVDAEEDPELLLPSHVVSRVRRVAQDLQIHDWSLARCLDHVHDGLAGVIPFERMGLALISEDRQEVELHWARSSRAIRLDRGFRSPLAGSVTRDGHGLGATAHH